MSADELGEVTAEGGISSEFIARCILRDLYDLVDPTEIQLAVAKRQVKLDAEGSLWLAAGGRGQLPSDREDLRSVRARGVYLRNGAETSHERRSLDPIWVAEQVRAITEREQRIRDSGTITPGSANRIDHESLSTPDLRQVVDPGSATEPINTTSTANLTTRIVASVTRVVGAIMFAIISYSRKILGG